MEISKSISVAKEFTETINRCLQREKEWVKYHAETLADLTLEVNVEKDAIEGASAERRALQLWRDGYHEKAIGKLTKRAESAWNAAGCFNWLPEWRWTGARKT